MSRTVKKIIAIFTVITIFCLILTDCNKTVEPRTFVDAIITGYDVRACVCCGGLMVNFNNDPIPYSGEFYLINELPDNTGIDTNTKFPLYVRIIWEFNTRICGSTKFVDIKKLEIK